MIKSARGSVLISPFIGNDAENQLSIGTLKEGFNIDRNNINEGVAGNTALESGSSERHIISTGGGSGGGAIGAGSGDRDPPEERKLFLNDRVRSGCGTAVKDGRQEIIEGHMGKRLITIARGSHHAE